MVFTSNDSSFAMEKGEKIINEAMEDKATWRLEKFGDDENNGQIPRK